MKGNIKDKTLKLYVKEDDTDKFEYLRDVSFKKNTLTSLNIDGKTYTKIKNLDKKTDPTKLSNNDNEGKVEIIYLNKDKNKENNKKDLYTNNSKDKNIEDENLDTDLSVILPSGLGERGNKVIKISQGFSDKEKSLNSKAMRLMRRKNYNKAVKIFLDLYSNNNKNISLLIKIEQVYSITGNKTEANKYCKKIKKYDPFYLCGG
jgi:tetratricopeptide (TPR) repeat protein